MKEKPKIPWEIAFEAATQVEEWLAPACERIQIAGSLRRRKPYVGDIEILCIPKRGDILTAGELFPREECLLTNRIEQLIEEGALRKRHKTDGTQTFGQQVKLLFHQTTGIPVDIFSTSEKGWVNNLVSRTGGKATNIRLASRAKELGMHWQPFGQGFQTTTSKTIQPETEEDVFQILGLPFLTPSQRT